MQAQHFNNTVRVLVVVLLPLLALAACDSVDSSGDPTPQARHATVAFDATANWPSYGEDIHATGTRSLQYKSAASRAGDFEVLVQPEAIDAAFTGLASGDSYEYHLANAAPQWSAFGGPAGAEEYFSETIMLMNERTQEESEGVVVTRAKIGEGGDVTFEVTEIIALPN